MRDALSPERDNIGHGLPFAEVRVFCCQASVCPDAESVAMGCS